ncbi:hypothetical protein [Mycobacterium innocens]|nr:hypothetical protein [Mycobacterium innocens]
MAVLRVCRLVFVVGLLVSVTLATTVLAWPCLRVRRGDRSGWRPRNHES